MKKNAHKYMRTLNESCEHVSLREHACVSSRGAQSTELVSLYIGYWTLNNYYYYYYYYVVKVYAFRSACFVSAFKLTIVGMETIALCRIV